jgi:hypothetical protein
MNDSSIKWGLFEGGKPWEEERVKYFVHILNIV